MACATSPNHVHAHGHHLPVPASDFKLTRFRPWEITVRRRGAEVRVTRSNSARNSPRALATNLDARVALRRVAHDEFLAVGGSQKRGSLFFLTTCVSLFLCYFPTLNHVRLKAAQRRSATQSCLRALTEAMEPLARKTSAG